MPITGKSQGKGVVRILDITPHPGGLHFHIHDKPDADREKIVVGRRALDDAMADNTPGPKTLTGTAPNGEGRKLLDIEVRDLEVEVRLWIRTEEGGGWDIAVLLDDFTEELDRATGN